VAIWHSSLPPFWSTDRLLENCFPPGQNVGQWLGNHLFMRTGDTPTTTHNTDLSASVRIELDMDHLFGSRRPLATIAPIDLIFANRFHINHIPLACMIYAWTAIAGDSLSLLRRLVLSFSHCAKFFFRVFFYEISALKWCFRDLLRGTPLKCCKLHALIWDIMCFPNFSFLTLIYKPSI